MHVGDIVVMIDVYIYISPEAKRSFIISLDTFQKSSLIYFWSKPKISSHLDILFLSIGTFKSLLLQNFLLILLKFLEPPPLLRTILN
jgi:hypothetical protein